jgi:predicted transcriptional regulator
VALSQTEIQARITAIRKARDAGVMRVRHGDEETWFRSLKEMNSIIADLEAQLAAILGTAKRKRLLYPRQDSKGY